MLQRQRNSGGKQLELIPCCTATQFSSLQLFYMDSNNTATQKTLPNMVRFPFIYSKRFFMKFLSFHRSLAVVDVCSRKYMKTEKPAKVQEISLFYIY